MEEAFIDYLAGAVALQAIVGERIDWNIRPQSENVPCVSLHVISDLPFYSDEGFAGLTSARIQADHWAKTYKEAKEASRATTNRLSYSNGAKFTHQGIEFQVSFKEDEHDDFDMGNAEEGLHNVSVDFILMYKEIN